MRIVLDICKSEEEFVTNALDSACHCPFEKFYDIDGGVMFDISTDHIGSEEVYDSVITKVYPGLTYCDFLEEFAAGA